MATSKQTTVGTVSEETLAYTAGDDARLDHALAEVDCIGTAAHVTMLSKMPGAHAIFTAEERDRVIAELVRVLRTVRRGSFTISVEDQDVHMAVERMLTKRVGALGKKVHTGRSRNDQVALDLRLYARNELRGMIDAAVTLAGELAKFSKRHSSVPMVGRTHMQPAMPSSVGLWAGAHAESLLDDIALLEGAYQINNQCPLGAAAGYGVPLPIDRKATASMLAFDAPVHNVLHAVSARGKIEGIILNALAQVMLTLSRLAQDLILYSMPEFAYFVLPPDMCTGSSIMPQKNNPDVLELMRARAARVQSAANTVAEMARAMPSGYNRDTQETKGLLMEGIATTRNSLDILQPLISATSVSREALLAGFSPDVFATDRALELVAEGMPFRDAYQYVKEHLDELDNRTPADAVALKTHYGAPAGLDHSELSSRIRAARRTNRSRARAWHRAASRLLGVSYPELA